MARAILVLLIFFAASPVSAIRVWAQDLSVELQWFDAQSNNIELQWPTRLRWVWLPSDSKPGSPVQPWLQAWIEVPESVQLAPEAGDSHARVFNDADSLGQLLVLETQNPREIKRLEMIEDGEHRKVGLTLSIDVSSPVLLVHDSCSQQGIELELSRPAVSPWLFSALICDKDKINLISSADADASPKSFSFNAKGEPISVSVVQKLAGPGSKATLIVSKPKKPTTPKVRQNITRPAHYRRNREFTVGASASFLHYNGSSAETALRLQARGRWQLSKHTFFSTLLAVPMVSVLPRVRMPASGFYELLSQLGWVSSRKPGAFKLRAALGPNLMYVRLRDRPGASGLVVGPAFTLGVEGQHLRRFLRAEARVVPLAGRGIEPVFHSSRVGVEAAVGLVPESVNARLWDLVLRYDYGRLSESDGDMVDAAILSLGVQTCF